MKQIRLADNLNVAALGKADAKVVYHEIFEMQAYNKHGIVIKNGDTIMDVGANIGLFSIHLAKQYKGLTLYLFEPVPQIFNCLSENSKRYLNENAYILQQYGLSDKATEVIFEFVPSLSMTTGMYAGELSTGNVKGASVYQWLIALIQDVERAGLISSRLSAVLLRLLSGRISRYFLLTFLIIPLSVFIARLHFSKRKVSCTLKTFSESLVEHGIEMVDLVKIDVEGAEMDVLKGVAPGDWKKIRQLIIEVHDVNGRLHDVSELLKDQGFVVTVDREDWSLHQLMNIYTVYAVKA